MYKIICTLPALALALALTATSAFSQDSTVVHADQTTQQKLPVAEMPPVIKPGDRACLRETGSRIRAKPGRCLPVVGKSYSGDELRRTGSPNNARALQMLDPSISVGH